MIITLTRTGGFTGIPLKKTIDTSKIDPEKAKEIKEMMRNVSKETNETEETKETNGVDRFTYTISVQDGERSQEVKLDEASLSPQLKDLIGRLEELDL